jgi:hypothetical protein
MKLILILCLLSLGVSCSSKREAQKEVAKSAEEVVPALNANIQYARAIAMVKSNPDLNKQQQEKLIALITDYSVKDIQNKMELSQYRVVLLNEMLNTGSRDNPKVRAAKNDLKKLNQESSEQLEKFIDDFKSTVGRSAKNHQPVLIEVLSIQ